MDAFSKEELIEKALDARRESYSPYSGFAVGAAILTDSGKVYSGANIENASFGATICAERVAADGLNAVAEGHVLQVRAAVELVFRDFGLLVGDGDGFEARVAGERRVAVAGVSGVRDVAADVDGVERTVGEHGFIIP